MSDDVFSRFGSRNRGSDDPPSSNKRDNVQSLPTKTGGMSNYSAYDTGRDSRPESRLRLNFGGGVEIVLNYTHLTEIRYTHVEKHEPEVIALWFVETVFVLVGHNLQLVLNLLQDDMIRTLHKFDKTLHLPPDDFTQPIITEMWRDTSAQDPNAPVETATH